MTRVRKIILQVAPQAKESIKWAQPVYESNGPFAYLKAFKNDVNFGFWRGVDIQDPKGFLKGTGVKMRHAKLTNLENVDESAFADFICQAIELALSKEGYGGIFQIGTGVETSINKLIEIMGYKGKVEYEPEREGEIRRRGDKEKGRRGDKE